MRLTQVDRVFSWAVKVLYILALAFSFFAFFAETVVSVSWATVGFGIALTLALILHELLSQLRFGTLLTMLHRLPKNDPKYKGIRAQAMLHGFVMFLLLMFDIFCSLEYQSSIKYHLTLLPPLGQIGVQGLSIPILFLLSTFLIEFSPDAASVLNRQTMDMLFATLAVAKRQWNTRLHGAESNGKNFAPIVITLSEDAGDFESANRIRRIEEGLAQTEGVSKGSTSAKLYSSRTQAAPGVGASGVDYPNEPPVAGSPASPFRLTRKTRAAIKLSERERIFKYLSGHPNASIQDTMRGAKVGSKGTVIKYRNQWLSEHPEAELEMTASEG